MICKIDYGKLVAIDEEVGNGLCFSLSFVVRLGGAFFILGPLGGCNHSLYYYFLGITMIYLSTRDKDNSILNCLMLSVLMVLLDVIYEIYYLE